MNDNHYNLMLDPSMLLHIEEYDQAYEDLERLKDEGAEIFIPQAFREFLDLHQQREADGDTVDQFMRFYAEDRSSGTVPETLFDQLRRAEDEGLISAFDPEPELQERHSDIRSHLQEDFSTYGIESPLLLESVFQEWVFLQEQSWITSQTRRAFDFMIRAGSASVEIGKRTLDKAVRKTREIEENEAITRADRLVVVGKWVVIGGSAAIAAGLISPPAGIVFGAEVAPYFIMLIDP